MQNSTLTSTPKRKETACAAPSHKQHPTQPNATRVGILRRRLIEAQHINIESLQEQFSITEMSGLPVLLGLCVYFLLTSAVPLDGYLHELNASFLASNISNSRVVITDTSADDYLTLLSAPFDVDNPNPVDKGFVHDDSDGQYP